MGQGLSLSVYYMMKLLFKANHFQSIMRILHLPLENLVLAFVTG